MLVVLLLFKEQSKSSNDDNRYRYRNIILRVADTGSPARISKIGDKCQIDQQSKWSNKVSLHEILFIILTQSTKIVFFEL